MAQYISKALLAVDVPNRYSQQRRAKKEAAVKSGSTSVRVSKKTLEGLRRVAHELAQLGEWRRHFGGYDVPLSELLEWIATSQIIKPSRELADACNAAIAAKHAELDVGKSMQRRRPPAVHAPYAGDGMQNTLESEKHAKQLQEVGE